jgi:hypothetical protein
MISTMYPEGTRVRVPHWRTRHKRYMRFDTELTVYKTVGPWYLLRSASGNMYCAAKDEVSCVGWRKKMPTDQEDGQ